MSERWAPIPGYEGLYEVSDFGNVRSLDRISRNRWGEYVRKGVPLVPIPSPKGHMNVGLHNRGFKRHQVHRLVMAAFVGDSQLQVRHLNGNPADNRLSNLAYGTNSENQGDSVEHGTHHHARKMHCVRGHEYTPENTGRQQRGRKCILCRRENQRSYMARKRAHQ